MLALVMLIASTVIFGLLFFPAATCALTVPITANFRQQGMIEIIETYFLAWYFLSLPLVILGALAAAWAKYHQKAYRIAILLSLLPAAYIVLHLAVEFLFDGVLKGLAFP